MLQHHILCLLYELSEAFRRLQLPNLFRGHDKKKRNTGIIWACLIFSTNRKRAIWVSRWAHHLVTSRLDQ